MPHDHHHHHHVDPASGDRRVFAAVAVNFALTFVQIVAGVLSGSLALIADAIHNLSDAISLVIAFAARRIARRPADASMTFGYGRAEVVAALINYTTLIVIAFYLAAEGVNRLMDPPEVQGWIVVVVAAIALVVDTVTALLIYRMSKDSVNMRAAFLHNLMDAMGSVAVIIGGTLILIYDWRLVDPIVTLMIAGYILWHTGREVGPVIRILMLGSPTSLAAEDVLAEMGALEGVDEIHHMHLWQMGEHETSLEAHVVLEEDASPRDVKSALKALLVDRFGITHSVLELESASDRCCDALPIGHACNDPTHRHA
ncbi:cation diffusion facilitator family transporter [Tropicimonas sp. TH_r6]|uniref:cation diffusion facilitator family transporter n=1 Tax=Tropicimonas sp. TH_r6 TaxID=3082085 RepID=UPI0029552410|nr:cation diffusion facilitator family transporter [Tropicimonas sp. TH_r6]MDV7144618.1 cation diffusion facilitator family transporter [Tropicimonas sp. TH_r6]